MISELIADIKKHIKIMKRQRKKLEVRQKISVLAALNCQSTYGRLSDEEEIEREFLRQTLPFMGKQCEFEQYIKNLEDLDR